MSELEEELLHVSCNMNTFFSKLIHSERKKKTKIHHHNPIINHNHTNNSSAPSFDYRHEYIKFLEFNKNAFLHLMHQNNGNESQVHQCPLSSNNSSTLERSETSTLSSSSTTGRNCRPEVIATNEKYQFIHSSDSGNCSLHHPRMVHEPGVQSDDNSSYSSPIPIPLSEVTPDRDECFDTSNSCNAESLSSFHHRKCCTTVGLSDHSENVNNNRHLFNPTSPSTTTANNHNFHYSFSTNSNHPIQEFISNNVSSPIPLNSSEIESMSNKFKSFRRSQKIEYQTFSNMSSSTFDNSYLTIISPCNINELQNPCSTISNPPQSLLSTSPTTSFQDYKSLFFIQRNATCQSYCIYGLKTSPHCSTYKCHQLKTNTSAIKQIFNHIPHIQYNNNIPHIKNSLLSLINYIEPFQSPHNNHTSNTQVSIIQLKNQLITTLPHIADHFECANKNARNTPSMSAGYNVTDCNKYASNRLDSLGTIRPTQSNLLQNFSPDIKHSIAQIIIQLIKLHLTSSEVQDIFHNSLDGQQCINTRINCRKKFAESLGLSWRDPEVQEYFVIDGFSVIMNNLLSIHTDDKNDRGPMDITFSLSVVVEVDNNLLQSKNFCCILKKSGISPTIGSKIPVALMCYTRECVGKMCRYNASLQKVVSSKASNPLLAPIVDAFKKVHDSTNFNRLFDNFDSYKQEFNFMNEKSSPKHNNFPQFSGRVCTTTAAYDKSVSEICSIAT